MTTFSYKNVTIKFDDSSVEDKYAQLFSNAIKLLKKSSTGIENIRGTTELTVVVNEGYTGPIRYKADRDALGNHINQKIELGADFDNLVAGKYSYIGNDGGRHTATTDRLIIHELVHALTKKEDIDLDIRAVLASPAGDFIGDTVRHANQIMSEVSNDIPRAHYPNLTAPALLSSVDANGDPSISKEEKALLTRTDYTFGNMIDQVLTGSARASEGSPLTIDSSGGTAATDALLNSNYTRPTNDLIVSFDTQDTIRTGGGNDYIYGGGGIDTIDAGSGNDWIWGGSGNDIINGGDGTDTVVVNGLEKSFNVETNGLLFTKISRIGKEDEDTLTSIEQIHYETPECFPAGTLIHLWDGSEKPIENITPSDIVLSFNNAGELVPGRVTQLLDNVTEEWLKLSYSAVAGGQAEAHQKSTVVTPGHRYLRPDGSFMEIKDIIEQDGLIVDVDGEIVQVTAERIIYSAETAHLFETHEKLMTPTGGSAAFAPEIKTGWRTYNFTVAETHTYIADGIRVHNDSIVSQIAEDEEIISLYIDENGVSDDAAILRDVDGDGVDELVLLDGDHNGPHLVGYREKILKAPDDIHLFEYLAEGDPNKSYDGMDDVQGDSYTVNGETYTVDVYGNVFDPGRGNIPNDGITSDDLEELATDDMGFTFFSESDYVLSLGDDVRQDTVTLTTDGDDLIFDFILEDGTRVQETVSNIVGYSNLILADGSERSLDDVPETQSYDGIVMGTGEIDIIDGSYSDADGDVVSTGDDTIFGLGGNDTIDGGAGSDTIDGGAGDDRIHYDSDDLTLAVGGDDTDTLIVTDETAPRSFNLVEQGFELAEVIQNDDADGADDAWWEQRIDTYNDNWQRQSIEHIYDDDAGSNKTTYDLDDEAWSSMTEYFTSDGDLQRKIVNYDDGTRENTLYDLDDQKVWSSFTDRFNTDGDVTERVTVGDDGTGNKATYDVADNEAWTQTIEYFDADNFTFKKDTMFDVDNGDGISRTLEFFDGEEGTDADLKSWASFVDYFDEDGFRYQRVTTDDDGTVRTNEFSAAANVKISSFDELQIANDWLI